MACLICGGNNAQEEVFEYHVADKYEAYMHIGSVWRKWWVCKNCGHYHQTRNYELKRLEEIYQHGYRAMAFREEGIEDAYERIMGIPWSQSENKQRADWFALYTHHESTLDIGSGIGVFPAALKEFGYTVECVEENKLSRDFISEKLNMLCWDSIPDSKYWNVSLVHVLEHIEEPDAFLQKIKPVCKRHLFIEVPDAREFAYLPKEHDEFNSCHLWFFTLQNLITLIERNGFTVVEASRKFYPQRKLSRILVLATV
jgi:hypothetical protein